MGNLAGEHIVRILYHACSDEGNSKMDTNHFSALVPTGRAGEHFAKAQSQKHVAVKISPLTEDGILGEERINEDSPSFFELDAVNLDSLGNPGRGLCGYYTWVQLLNLFGIKIPAKMYRLAEMAITLQDNPVESRLKAILMCRLCFESGDYSTCPEQGEKFSAVPKLRLYKAAYGRISENIAFTGYLLFLDLEIEHRKSLIITPSFAEIPSDTDTIYSVVFCFTLQGYDKKKMQVLYSNKLGDHRVISFAGHPRADSLSFADYSWSTILNNGGIEAGAAFVSTTCSKEALQAAKIRHDEKDISDLGSELISRKKQEQELTLRLSAQAERRKKKKVSFSCSLSLSLSLSFARARAIYTFIYTHTQTHIRRRWMMSAAWKSRMMTSRIIRSCRRRRCLYLLSRLSRALTLFLTLAVISLYACLNRQERGRRRRRRRS